MLLNNMQVHYVIQAQCTVDSVQLVDCLEQDRGANM